MLMKKMGLFFVSLAVSCSTQASNIISETSLTNYNSLFLSKVIKDNPEREERIRTYLNGMVMEGHRGIHLLDKFGLFLGNMEKKEIEIERIRFFYHADVFTIFFVMRDLQDDQLYTMYLEYEYGDREQCVLKEIYFSLVFEERMNDIRSFFEAR
ncbi:MAG: hypothetical protein JW807_10445 [Spirochaetes bacterium]|nr:hypothetical protein [Spirochaetota bacterium]